MSQAPHLKRFFLDWFFAGLIEPDVGREVLVDLGGKRTRMYITSDIFARYVSWAEKTETGAHMTVNFYKRGERNRGSLYAIDKIFFDFDSKEDKDLARADAFEFVDRVKEIGIIPMIVDTTHKGFHVFVFLQNPIRVMKKEDAKTILVSVVEWLLDGFNPKTLDRNPLFNPQSMARIPTTIHPSTGKRTVIIDFEGSVMTYRSKGIPSDELKRHILVLGEQKLNKIFKTIFLSTRRQRGVTGHIILSRENTELERHYPPCLRHVFKQLREGVNLTHPQRFFLVSYLHLAGWDEDSIVELFRRSPDFNEKLTRYQVHHIISRGYRPHGCRRRKTELGLPCPFDDFTDCPWHKKIVTLTTSIPVDTKLLRKRDKRKKDSKNVPRFKIKKASPEIFK